MLEASYIFFESWKSKTYLNKTLKHYKERIALWVTCWGMSCSWDKDCAKSLGVPETVLYFDKDSLRYSVSLHDFQCLMFHFTIYKDKKKLFHKR